MKCAQCGEEVNAVGGVFIGSTAGKVPVVQSLCANGHPTQTQLQVIKNMDMLRSENYPPAPGNYQGSKAENIQLCCPICRGNFGLGIGKGPHSLNEETGVITPSMVCPYGCGWHTHITLDGWEKS